MQEENKSEEEFVLKPFRQEKKIKIQLTEDGPVEEYRIITITGAEKVKYQNSMIGRTRYKADGTPIGVNKYDGMEASLISLCLRDADGNVIPPATIESWASPALAWLAKECVKFNGLGKDEEDEKK